MQGFEAAGVRLLQAAVRSKPQLSATTLQRVVKQLLAGKLHMTFHA